MEIRIKYYSDRIEKLRYINGVSDWIDLRAAEDVTMKAGEFRLIPLGVGMELPPSVFPGAPHSGISGSCRPIPSA